MAWFIALIDMLDQAKYLRQFRGCPNHPVLATHKQKLRLHPLSWLKFAYGLPVMRSLMRPNSIRL
ncbi:unnamed protein product [Protopolystoma xenopodis]|uniref:Uncharacterized protein n=1 Tax=Protopolystoma xenopodis TaxID=117903 RepID=A0A448WPK5_9PLAT|nr:unnamed protein product [Protopolystoma xenopodis]